MTAACAIMALSGCKSILLVLALQIAAIGGRDCCSCYHGLVGRQIYSSCVLVSGELCVTLVSSPTSCIFIRLVFVLVSCKYAWYSG